MCQCKAVVEASGISCSMHRPAIAGIHTIQYSAIPQSALCSYLVSTLKAFGLLLQILWLTLNLPCRSPFDSDLRPAPTTFGPRQSFRPALLKVKNGRLIDYASEHCAPACVMAAFVKLQTSTFFSIGHPCSIEARARVACLLCCAAWQPCLGTAGPQS